MGNRPIQEITYKARKNRKRTEGLAKESIENIKLQISVAKGILWNLDTAEEGRELQQSEREFRQRIRLKYQGLLAIDKIRVKQRARLCNIRTADANTKLFHLRANGRKRKNHIQVLQTETGPVVTQRDKEKEIHSHFSKALGQSEVRNTTLSWDDLNIMPFDLQ